MRSSQKTWIACSIAAFAGLILWLTLAYPQFSFINLSVSRQSAVKIAKKYLQDQRKINPENYQYAVVLHTDSSADRYLQKSIGFDQETLFLKQNKISLFSWLIRFFQEEQKEEFLFSVNASNGEITSFHYTIEDTAPKEEMAVEQAIEQAQLFLSKNFSIDFSQYTLKEKTAKTYDRRTDFSFCWQKNEINIPWNKEKDAGTAKLLIRAKVSGNDILYFNKSSLDIPDDFNRMVEKSKQAGAMLNSIFQLFYYLLLGISIFYVVTRQNSLVLDKVKKFYIWLAASLLFAGLLLYLNNFQNILMTYPTTSALKIYFSEIFVQLFIFCIFTAVAAVLPGLAAETLTSETKLSVQGFARYIQTTFLSKEIFQSVTIGYLLAIFLLGVQAAIFFIGQKYCGVWIERLQLTQMSSSFWPFLAVFAVSFRAAMSEEISFRFFGLQWGQKIFKNTIVTIIILSAVWGFGHTKYPIFPTWFRGLEVTLLGTLFSCFYLRFGIVTVITAHFLIDCFWGSTGFLFGHSRGIDFMTCLFVLFLPLFFGFLAFAINKQSRAAPASTSLTQRQLYNLKILVSFISNPKNTKGKSAQNLRQELISNGWEAAVVDEAIKYFLK